MSSGSGLIASSIPLIGSNYKMMIVTPLFVAVQIAVPPQVVADEKGSARPFVKNREIFTANEVADQPAALLIGEGSAAPRCGFYRPCP